MISVITIIIIRNEVLIQTKNVLQDFTNNFQSAEENLSKCFHETIDFFNQYSFM
jgi:cell shape-determining protein MreC